MELNVFSTETNGVVRIDSKEFNSKVHLHRNTHKAFSKEDIASFGGKKAE